MNNARYGKKVKCLQRLFLSFLLVGLGVSETPALAATQSGSSAGFVAGVGQADIVFPTGTFPAQGFVGQHDPLRAKLVVMKLGDAQVALAVVDQTSMSEDSIHTLQTVISNRTGVPVNHILIGASHTFSAPHVMSGGHASQDEQVRMAVLAKAVEVAMDKAAVQAAGHLVPAWLGAATGRTSVNISRDMHSASGWWLGEDPTGFSDKDLNVIRLDDAQQHALAILVNASVQPSVMSDSTMRAGGRLVSADLAGAATQWVESAYRKQSQSPVSLFLEGAAGDQSPVLTSRRYVMDVERNLSIADSHEDGFAVLDLLGERLGAESVLASEEASRQTAEPSQLRLERGEVTVAAQTSQRPKPGGLPPAEVEPFETAGDATVPYWVLLIGRDTAVVGVREELSSQTGARIRSASPFKNTLVVTMVNGAAKYMPEASAYDRFTYEARSSSYAKGAAERLTKKVIETLRRMENEAVR